MRYENQSGFLASASDGIDPQMTAWLSASPANLLPYLALSRFCGLTRLFIAAKKISSVTLTLDDLQLINLIVLTFHGISWWG
jgi:hypothetical protein